jgi:hypothetical protein
MANRYGPAILRIRHDWAGHQNPSATSVLHLDGPVQTVFVWLNGTIGSDVFEETSGAGDLKTFTLRMKSVGGKGLMNFPDESENHAEHGSL